MQIFHLPKINRAPETPGGPPAQPENAAFLAMLPEEMRTNPEFKDFKAVPDLAKSYVERGKLVGMDKLPLPKDDAKPEDWDPVFKRLGRPDKADGYKLPELKDLKHLKAADEGTKKLIDGFTSTAHKLGLSQKAAEGLYQWYMTSQDAEVQGSLDAYDRGRLEAEASLKEEYGAAYPQRVEFAHRAVKHFGGDDLVKFLDDTQLGNHPALIRAFAKIGMGMTEEQLVGMSRDHLTKSPQEAKSELDALTTDKAFMEAYNDKGHAGHKGAVAKRSELYALAYPEPKRETAS